MRSRTPIGYGPIVSVALALVAQGVGAASPWISRERATECMCSGVQPRLFEEAVESGRHQHGGTQDRMGPNRSLLQGTPG